MAIGDFYLATASHTTGVDTSPLSSTPNWIKLPALTYRELTARPSLSAEGPGDIKTGIRYSYPDRDRLGHKNGDRVDSDRALALTDNEERSTDQELRLISRTTQAKAWATEAVRYFGRPSMSGKIKVRFTILESRGIIEGSLFMLDVQTEPGGTAKFRMFRCLKVTRTDDEATVEVRLEIPHQSAIVVSKQGSLMASSSSFIPAVPHRRFFILPPALNSGAGYGVGLLASRGTPLVQQTAISYDDDAGGDFPAILTSRGFAAFGYLTADATRWGSGNAYGTPADWLVGVSVSVGDLRAYAGQVWRVLTAHTTSISNRPDSSVKWTNVPVRFALYDAGELYRLSGGASAADQRNNKLLLVVLNRTGSDITVTAGQPQVEIFSVGVVAAFGSADTGPTGDPAPQENNIYALGVLRGRYGTPALSFAAGAEAWLVFADDLPKMTHKDFQRLADIEADALFKLVPGNSHGNRRVDDGQIAFQFIGANAFWPAVTWTTPANGATVGTTSAANVPFSGSITDADGNLTSYSVTWRRCDGALTTALSASIGATTSKGFSVLVSFPASGSYHVFVTGQDSSGNIGQSVRTVIVDPTAGASTIVATPVLSPFGGYHFAETYPVTVTASCTTAGATIEMVVTATSQTSIPGSGWTTTTTASAGVNQRVWARATKVALTDSAVAYVDFLQRPS